MVKNRLRRMGSAKQPFYRIVAADARKARGGRFLDTLGYYDPLKKPLKKVIGKRKPEQVRRTLEKALGLDRK